MRLIIQETVDINKCPTVDTTFINVPEAEFTLGDLHGNFLKLFFILIRCGIANNVSEIDYQQSVKIYTKSTDQITREDLDKFNELLDKIQFNSSGLLRLLGDELADRGSNDYFTLKLLEKLQQKKVPFKILASNHGIEFLNAFEKGKKFAPEVMTLKEHCRSIHNLQSLIDCGLVQKTEIVEIVNLVYKPALEAIAYSLNEDNTAISIYSHAGIGLNTIEEVAKQLGVLYKDDTAAAIAETIDSINEEFQSYVNDNKVHELCPKQELNKAYRNEPSKLPFVSLIWNRIYENLNRPRYHKGYGIFFIHGHDSTDKKDSHIINLDNVLGKFHHGEDHNTGDNCIFYTSNIKTAAKHTNKRGENVFFKLLGTVPSLLPYALKHAGEAVLAARDKHENSLGHLAANCDGILKDLIVHLPSETILQLVTAKNKSQKTALGLTATQNLPRLANILRVIGGEAALGEALKVLKEELFCKNPSIEIVSDILAALLQSQRVSVRTIQDILSIFPAPETKLVLVGSQSRFGKTALGLATRVPVLLETILEALVTDENRKLALEKAFNEECSTRNPSLKRLRNILFASLQRKTLSYEIVKSILSSFHSLESRLELVRYPIKWGNSVLHWAAREPTLFKLILELLSTDENRMKALRALNNQKETPLHLLFDSDISAEAVSDVLSIFSDKRAFFEAFTIKDSKGVAAFEYAIPLDRVLNAILTYFSTEKALALEFLQKTKALHTMAVHNTSSLRVILSHLPNDKARQTALGILDQNNQCPFGLMAENYPVPAVFSHILLSFDNPDFGLKTMFMIKTKMVEQRCFPTEAGEVLVNLFLERIGFERSIQAIECKISMLQVQKNELALKAMNKIYNDLVKAKENFLTHKSESRFISDCLVVMADPEITTNLQKGDLLQEVQLVILDPVKNNLDKFCKLIGYDNGSGFFNQNKQVDHKVIAHRYRVSVV